MSNQDRTVAVPSGMDLPDLLYVAGGDQPALRVFYLVSDDENSVVGDPPRWANVITDRDLEIATALVRLAQRRLEEVRRGRNGG